jgi:hypothetical protein
MLCNIKSAASKLVGDVFAKTGMSGPFLGILGLIEARKSLTEQVLPGPALLYALPFVAHNVLIYELPK